MELGRWRARAAVWGSAAWLVLRQFGVPAASRPARSFDIVRVQEAGEAWDAAERLPDGRILTVSTPEHDDRHRQGDETTRFGFTPN
jgi:hypothetical protein